MDIQDTFNEICSFSYQEEILAISRLNKLTLFFKNNFPDYIKQRFLKFHNNIFCLKYSCNVDFPNYGKMKDEEVFIHACFNDNLLIVKNLVEKYELKNEGYLDKIQNTFKKLSKDTLVHNGLLISIIFGRTNILRYFCKVFFEYYEEIIVLLVFAIQTTYHTYVLDLILSNLCKKDKYVMMLYGAVDKFLREKNIERNSIIHNNISYVFQRFHLFSDKIVYPIFSKTNENISGIIFGFLKSRRKKAKSERIVDLYGNYFEDICFLEENSKIIRIGNGKPNWQNNPEDSNEKFIYVSESEEELKVYNKTRHDYFFSKIINGKKYTVIHNTNVGKSYSSCLEFVEDFIDKISKESVENYFKKERNVKLFDHYQVDKVIDNNNNEKYDRSILIGCSLLAKRKGKKISNKILEEVKYFDGHILNLDDFDYDRAISFYVRFKEYRKIADCINKKGKISWNLLKSIFVSDSTRITGIEYFKSTGILEKYYFVDLLKSYNDDYKKWGYEYTLNFFFPGVEKFVEQAIENNKLPLEAVKYLVDSKNEALKKLGKNISLKLSTKKNSNHNLS